jgi:hypothetical protein
MLAALASKFEIGSSLQRLTTMMSWTGETTVLREREKQNEDRNQMMDSSLNVTRESRDLRDSVCLARLEPTFYQLAAFLNASELS